MSGFLPDESTLAGRLCALASAAELGLLTAEYQHKRQSRGVRFSHAPRFVGSKGGDDTLESVDSADLVTFVTKLVFSGGKASLSALAFQRIFASEAFANTAMMTICLHCFGVFYHPMWVVEKPPDFCSEECMQAAEQALQRARRQRKRHYIRFGLWDAATEMSINFQTGVHEPGVGAYDAFYDPEDGCYRLDTAKVVQYARQAKRCLPQLFDRHIFIITGDETEPGTDGEPCLRNIRLIAPAIWRNHQIVPVPLERLLSLAEALSFGPDTSAGVLPPINGCPIS